MQLHPVATYLDVPFGQAEPRMSTRAVNTGSVKIPFGCSMTSPPQAGFVPASISLPLLSPRFLLPFRQPTCLSCCLEDRRTRGFVSLALATFTLVEGSQTLLLPLRDFQ